MEIKLSICALAALTILGAGCKESSSNSSPTPPPLHVEYATVTERAISDRVWFATTIESETSVTIEPRVNGYLQSVAFDGGDVVGRGEVLFTIDPSQLNTALYSAEADVVTAHAKFVEAENNYNRAIPLSRLNAISKSAYDEYSANYRSAMAAVKSAESALRSAELNLSYATLRSPIDGVVANSPAAVGDFVGPGTEFATLTTISNSDTVEVALALPTSQYLKYRSLPDSALLSDITLMLADSSVYPYRGLYSYVEKDAAQSSSRVVVVAKIPNPDGVLRANMFARVGASVGGAADRLLVPQSAVTQMQGVSSVWVVEPDSTVSLRMVNVGQTVGDEWIVESGVELGERVATSSQIKLHQGARVVPIGANNSKQ